MKLLQNEDFGMNLLPGKICCALLSLRGAILKVWSAWNGEGSREPSKAREVIKKASLINSYTHNICPS